MDTRKQVEDAIFSFLDEITSSNSRTTHYNDVISLVDQIEKLSGKDDEIEDLENTIDELEMDVDSLKSTIQSVTDICEDFVEDVKKDLTQECLAILKKSLESFKRDIHDQTWWV